MKNKQLVIENYKRFCALEGSDYIASEFALYTIIRLIDTFTVKNILEIGLGIGAICDTVLKYSQLNNYEICYDGTEKNEFCLNSLKKNVKNYNLFNLYSDISTIINKKYDLIIIDGYDDNFEIIQSFANERAIIFIEGARGDQTKSILTIFPRAKHVNIITLEKNKSYAHGNSPENHYIGGGQLIFTNPNIWMYLFWFKNKWLTYFKNNIRKIKNK